MSPAPLTDIISALGSFTNLTLIQPLTMAITPSSGLFSGSVTLTNDGYRVTRQFKGAILRRQNHGTGFFLGTNQSGRVYFGATSP